MLSMIFTMKETMTGTIRIINWTKELRDVMVEDNSNTEAVVNMHQGVQNG
jgi:hypothetical protein